MRLDGKTALITGGTQGIGAAIGLRLAQAGCNLLLHGLHFDEAAERTIQQCQSTGVQVRCILEDLSQPSEFAIPSLMGQIAQTNSVPEILVNNAGTFCDLPFLDMDHATYQRTMRINVESGYFLTQAFAKIWSERHVGGRVLFTGSINGDLAEPNHTAYDASKGAVRSLVRSLCVSLAPLNIRVNAIAPGLVITPLTAAAVHDDQDAYKWMQMHTPNGKVPGPKACAAAALFLVSDEADHIHGQTLLIDGGMSAWQQPDLPDALRGHL